MKHSVNVVISDSINVLELQKFVFESFARKSVVKNTILTFLGVLKYSVGYKSRSPPATDIFNSIHKLVIQSYLRSYSYIHSRNRIDYFLCTPLSVQA